MIGLTLMKFQYVDLFIIGRQHIGKRLFTAVSAGDYYLRFVIFYRGKGWGGKGEEKSEREKERKREGREKESEREHVKIDRQINLVGKSQNKHTVRTRRKPTTHGLREQL